MNRTAKIADFVSSADAGSIPSELRQKMRVHLIDTVAAGVAGSFQNSASRVRSAAPAGSTCPYWGGHGLGEPQHSALVNASAAHMLELDDTGGCDHSGVAVVPSLVAAAHAYKPQTTLGHAITSMAIGYEIARRVQFFLGGYSELNQRGWHSTSVCGPFGSAVAAAKILGLEQAQVQNALGIASSSAAGGWSFRSGGGENKALHAGFASSRGLESAVLASHNVSGTRDAFENVWGGIGSLYAQDEAVSPEALTAGLGRRWVAEDASIKPFPSCASSHPIVQLIERLIIHQNYHLKSVESINIKVSPLVVDICGEKDLSNLATFKQRQLSIPYLVALVLTRGRLTLKDLLERPASFPGLSELLSRVNIQPDPSITGAVGDGNMTVVHKGNGSTFSTDQVPDPRLNVASISQVLEKAEGTLQTTDNEKALIKLRSITEANEDELLVNLFSGL